MKHQTIIERFHSYLDTAYDPAAKPEPGSLQYQELRRCFYGAVFDATLNLDPLCFAPTAQRWMQECRGFVGAVKDGGV